jgi:glycosyltransferase involved in cell wall biosynthesis
MDVVADLTVIIPAFNEAEGLKKILPPLMAAATRHGWHVIVVNDASTDDTVEVVSGFAPEVKLINNRINSGYGASIKRGIRATETKWIATFDADGQHRLEDLERLAEVTEDDDAVVGIRDTGSYVKFSRIPGKWLLTAITNFLIGYRIPDINCGLRVMRRRIIGNIMALTSDRFSFSTSTLVALLKLDYQVRFVPVTTEKRIGNSAVRQFRDGLQTLMLVLHLIVLFDPLRIILPVAAGLFGAGVIIQIITSISHGWDINQLTIILCISGLILFVMALIADQLSALRREMSVNHHLSNDDRPESNKPSDRG